MYYGLHMSLIPQCRFQDQSSDKYIMIEYIIYDGVANNLLFSDNIPNRRCLLSLSQDTGLHYCLAQF